MTDEEQQLKDQTEAILAEYTGYIDPEEVNKLLAHRLAVAMQRLMICRNALAEEGLNIPA